MIRKEVNCVTGEIFEVEVTQVEIDALPILQQSPLEQIKAIETANPITHRMLRDLSMTVGQIAGAVTGQDITQNPAVKAIIALNAKIDPLRAQAKAEGLLP